MKLSDFDYELPPERIASRPAARRDASRMLVHRIGTDTSEHATVADIDRWLAPGDLLVVNDTRVVPARVLARRASGGAVELLMLEPAPGFGGGRAWRAMVNPARKLKPGEKLAVEGDPAVVRLLERPDAEWRVELVDAQAPELDVIQLLERLGHMPLPPYIERGDDEADRERYQTVYARAPGAVAAPTAGLHFTPELLERLAARGVERAAVTLHVGAGTFLPVKTDDPREHRMHAERYELSSETVAAVARTRAAGGRVVCVGTTTVRVLESCVDSAGELRPGAGETRLFLMPGSTLHVTDGLLTNFHLPKSTLLMLVSALAGRDRVLSLYREALVAGYRFYSYGDAMLLLKGSPAG